jgi:hypothetical protein
MLTRLHLHVNRISFWFPVVIGLRLISTFILFWLGEYSLSDGLIGNLATDSQDYYIATATNIAKNFTYAKHAGQPYAGHMPGYDVIIAPLLWLFEKNTALNILWVLQWLFGCISTYLLALIAYQLFNDRLVFAAVIVGYGLNTYVLFYDFFVLTESFAVSSLITGIFFYFRHGKLNLLLSGAFFTWSCFLRPYLFPVFFLFGFGLIWRYRKEIKMAFNYALIFSSVLVVAESLWIIRNYLQFDRFAPIVVHEQLVNQGRLLAIRKFMRTIGGDDTFWNPTAEVLIFYDSRKDKTVPALYKEPEDLPAYIFTKSYNVDSLRVLRNWYHIAENDTSLHMRRYADSMVVAIAERYRQAFIKEKPFHYYVVAPLRQLGKFLFNSGTYNLAPHPFQALSYNKKIVKIAYSGLYYFTWMFGVIGSLIALIKFSLIKDRVYLLCFTALYPLILFPIIYGSIEYRYFTLAYPFLFVLAVWIFIKMINKSKDKYFSST